MTWRRRLCLRFGGERRAWGRQFLGRWILVCFGGARTIRDGFVLGCIRREVLGNGVGLRVGAIGEG